MVRIAVVLMLVSLALALISVGIDWRLSTAEFSPAFLLISNGLVFALSLWLTWKIWHGRRFKS